MQPIYYYIIAVWLFFYLILLAGIYAGYKVLKQQIQTAIPPEIKSMLPMLEMSPQGAALKASYEKLKAKLEGYKKNPFVWLLFLILVMEFTPILVLAKIYALVFVVRNKHKLTAAPAPPQPEFSEAVAEQPTPSAPAEKKIVKPTD